MPSNRKKSSFEIISDKRKWDKELSDADKAKGFRGWHSRGYLPHFDVPGAIQCITYRLADSIRRELAELWTEAMELADEREKFHRAELLLDRGLGGCHLCDPRIARLVEGNLLFHDGKGYQLLAWVIMPNHVHVLAEMLKPLSVVLHSWKSYTSQQANKILGRRGEPFWKSDYFDRFIRDQEHQLASVSYIENNPVTAGLVGEPTAWQWSSGRHQDSHGVKDLQ